MKNKRSPFAPLAIVAFILSVVIVLTNSVKADDQPSPADLQNLEDIRQNQKVIEKNRPAHEEFLLFKGYNEAESSELAKNGWCPVWAENPNEVTLERCAFKKGPESHENLHGAAKTPPKPTGDRLAMLTKSCKGDERCICINNAIFKHDSGWATAGVGKKTNNAGNMRIPKTWKPSVPFTVYNSKGNGQFAKFETLEDGVQANVELYFRHYAKYENANALVNVWADGGGNREYRSAVASCF